MLTIAKAEHESQLEEVRSLFEQYAAEWPGDDLSYENFAEEVVTLPGVYAPPDGRLLLATYDGLPAGCVALKKLQDKVGELKRLYVQPRVRALKIGHQLTQALIEEARKAGYDIVRLDTVGSMVAATRLYQSLGFQQISPYGGKQPDGNIYMELRL